MDGVKVLVKYVLKNKVVLGGGPMEFFVVGFISLLLIPLILGWFLIGAALLLAPISGIIYFISVLPEKLKLSERVIEKDGVLVVDDQYITVIPLIKLLEQAQVPFKYVANGFEAIKELKNKQYKLVFMDYYMPMITGVEALTKVDQLLGDGSPATPVVFYTGADIAESEKSRFKHVSIVDSWDKSMNRLELHSKLQHVLFNS